MVGADPVTGTLITLGVKALGDALGGLTGGGSPRPVLRPSDKRALEAAGYDIRPRGRARGPVVVSPSGEVFRGRQELKDLRALVRSGNLNVGNRPPPGNNPPIPSSSAAWPFIVGSVYWGSKGPRKRPRVKRRKDYGGVPGGAVCGTDSQCEEWCADNPELCRALERQYELRKSIDMARGPMPGPLPPIVRPDVVTIAQALPPWAKLLLGVFWPSELGDSDLDPQTLPLPKGPTQRPRIGRPVRTAWPPPDFQAPSRPRPPPIRIPKVRPRPELDARVRTELETVRVTAQRIPEPARTPTRANPVVRAPTRTPTRVPTRIPTWLSDPLALLAPALLRQPQSQAAPRLISRPLTPPQQAPLAYPLQVPTRVTADQCQCEQPKRKRKQCSNPVVRKTKRTRGGRRYVTTTRRIDCA